MNKQYGHIGGKHTYTIHTYICMWMITLLRLNDTPFGIAFSKGGMVPPGVFYPAGQSLRGAFYPAGQSGAIQRNIPTGWSTNLD